MKKISTSVIKNLRIVFIVSGALLLISSAASYFSIRKLLYASDWVTHTYDVLMNTSNLAKSLRDAESSQRGYLLTKDDGFLQSYNGSYKRTNDYYAKIKMLTQDNELQQENIRQLKSLIDRRFAHLESVLAAAKISNATTTELYGQLIQGKNIMEQLEAMLIEIENEENRLLVKRKGSLNIYTVYTPILIVFAAIISIVITLLSFLRIRKELQERMQKQEEDERKYLETNQRISVIEIVTGKIAGGDYTTRSNDERGDELGRIGIALNSMAGSLEKSFTELEKRNWLQSVSVKINDSMRGHDDLQSLSTGLTDALAAELNVPVIAFYTATEDHFELQGGYAIDGAPAQLDINDGLFGQSIKSDKIINVDDVPDGFIKVSSSLGESKPNFLTIVPLPFARRTIGVLEIGSLNKLTDVQMEMLLENQEAIGISVNTVSSRVKLQELFEETQSQSEELQAQHNELENINSELEAQTEKLQASEEELKVQQEELLQANQEMEERSRLLEERNQIIVERNVEIQQKAEELALSTKYKSEFLANMSHELRTPLNSILLLSRLLSENNESNLSGDQVEYAQVIQSAGKGLLSLIDEILDLSKIESGKMELEYADVYIDEIVQDMKALFAPLAKEKSLEFDVNVDAAVPERFETDKMRLEQILKNLLSNALKFTTAGSVKMKIFPTPGDASSLSFTVKDSGIGIPADKQNLIFEAFQQADGSTRRKFGGTGLGLSISRELSRLLGGEIFLNSEPDQGSEFTVTVPLARNVNRVPELPLPAAKLISKPTESEEPVSEVKRFRSTIIPENIPDDRDKITKNDKVILIIEDDTGFAKALLDYTHSRGYKGLIAVRGDDGITLAKQYKPLGILLDIQLPIKDGWEVMEELKSSSETRHIPVHIMSSMEMKKESLMKGAVDFINKPMAIEQMQEIFKKIEHVLSKEHKKVLIVEENPQHARALSFFLENFNVSSQISDSVKNGIAALKKEDVDCVILDMGIPDQQAYQTLEEIKKNPGFESLPIIIFTGKSLSKMEEQKIRQYADSIVIKTAHSYQRILDEVSLFLHLVEENNLPAKQNSKYKRLGALGEVLAGKKILIADDDVRNIFSLTKALEMYQMKVVTAVDGKEALQALQDNPDTSLVLMDIMMPEMDGYQATQEIRKKIQYRNLPIIAVTAKAMSGDREKCIKAGASDYISKPVDIDQLLSLLRVWLYDKTN